MTALGRGEILAQLDCQPVALDVPEWGGVVYLRILTAGERFGLERRLVELDRTEGERRAALAAAFLCNEAGEPLFGPEDLEALARRSAAALERICWAGLEANRMRPEDLEDLRKNSTAGRSPASG